ncbi:cilia- and flagella-associated protein 61 [Salmo salar]|uniref:Cilia- and flagella-associated protein 61 n=1 Tax=Salmo salar TaxID=8030 RepID=A0ABM3EWQ0_SALSA|nr:cilia- and flagella-associated protein 61-like [Salmo salar]
MAALQCVSVLCCVKESEGLTGIISVPKLLPEFPLLQSFLKVTFDMRLAVSADRPAVCDMVKRLGWNTLADYIRANYNIKNVIYFSHHCYEEYGKWCHFALNPIFQHYAKHFPKRALQLAHKSCLYYPIYPSCHSQGNSCARYLTSVLNCMVPVLPRRQIVYPLDELGINTPSKQITKDQVGTAAAVQLAPARPLQLKWSRTATGYETELDHGYCDRDHTQLSLRSWINVVTGKRVGIDRAVKHVLVSGGRKVPYDHLIFYTGQQYQLFTDKEKIRQSLFGCLAPLLPSDLIFPIHVASDNTIDVYTCVGILLSLGVEGFRIHLPTDEGSSCSPSSCFGNHTVEKALENSGVHVHHNCFLAQMNDRQNPESITFVSFTSDTQPLRLECSLFMNLSSKGVNYDAFQSNNNACLVYDGRLVIDTTFHTSDSTIRAVRPLTKFPRHYHSDQWSHSRFNSREVVQELAAILLPFFDLSLEPAINPPADLDGLITNYTQAKI